MTLWRIRAFSHNKIGFEVPYALADAPVAKEGFYDKRCYMRDPDGYLIEVGLYTPAAIERFATFTD
jgi:hypothetical protein